MTPLAREANFDTFAVAPRIEPQSLTALVDPAALEIAAPANSNEALSGHRPSLLVARRKRKSRRGAHA